MFGSLTSPKRQRVNTLRLIHSLALRACILNGSSEHGAVQLGHEEKLKLARFTAGELFYARHIRALGFRKPKTENAPPSTSLSSATLSPWPAHRRFLVQRPAKYPDVWHSHNKL